MASSPKYKVYDAQGRYQASCKELEACGALMGVYNEGATVRLGHGAVLWTEGEDGCGMDSWDLVAQVAGRREREIHKAAFVKVHGQATYDAIMARTGGRG